MYLRMCVCAISLLLAGPVFAQSGTIAGTVKDQQQAVISGAQVVLTGERTETRAVTMADAQGRYSFASISADTYVVEVQAKGFRIVKSAPIVLNAGGNVTQDVTLTIAGGSESVTVTGRAGAAGGYRSDSVASLGSSEGVALLNAPYTISVLPHDLIDNGQVKSFKEASKFLPLVHYQEMQGSEVLRPETRGIQGSNMQNARMDGMGIVVTGANSVETLENIEVLNGVGGALFGPANPSGMFNFVPKRPTDAPLRQVTVGYDDRAVGSVRADVGGRVGNDKRFGYRANVLFGDGESFVKDSELKRGLASLAADFKPFTKTVIEGYYSYYNVVQRGFPGWFTYGRANARSAFILLPGDAPNPSQPGLGQHSAGVDLTSNIGEVRVKQEINRTWRLSVGVLDQRADRSISTQVNALTSSARNYTSSLATGFAPQFRVLSDLASLNGNFRTGSVNHDIAIGTAGYRFDSYSDFANPSAAGVLLGTASIAAPVVFGLPAAGLPTHNNLFLSSSVHQQGVNVSDLATFSRHWSVRVAASQDWISADTFNNAGVQTSSYRTNGVSPSASLIFKPADRMTLYGTYASSLQQGDIAASTTANPGQALPPYRSTQAEVGYKVALGRIDVSTAVFRLDRPFANIDPADNVFKISGDQINYGWEATVSGRLTDRLITSSGLTLLDTNVTKTGNPDTDGRRFVGIPAYRSNLLAEYRLPLGSATFVNANWQLVGRRPIDDVNSAWTPAYNVVDLGIRYARPLEKLKSRLTTWRLTVNNVTDVHYWSTLGPGNITGTNVGSYTAHLGAPRTVAASMEVSF
jgi:iron complex outermembrane receptor protein